MGGLISRRVFLTGSVAVMAAPALASAPAVSLRPKARGVAVVQRGLPSVEALIKKARLGGQVSYSVANVATGQVLEDHNASIGLPPASVAKAITAAYALKVLGPGHRFRTRVFGTGPVENGILKGDLVLAGGGDPTLDTNDLADLAAKLKAGGVREVQGRFLVWDGALPFVRQIDSSQPDQVSYNPAISGLNLNFNRVRFEWKKTGSDYTILMDARTDKYRPEVRIATMRVADRKSPVYTYEEKNGRDSWTVARRALGKGGARWLPVRNPAIYAGEVFQTMASAHGIRLKAPKQVKSLPSGTVLAVVESAKLSAILKAMLKHSTNLTAEVVGLWASKVRKGRVSGLRASANEMNRWAKDQLGMTKVALVDHSGLGDASRMTAGDMTRALVAARKHVDVQPLLKDIPMRDADRKILENHPVKVQAKTGTLNFVSGLAGYVRAPGGEELAFAVFAADTKRRSALTKAQRERPDGARSWNGRAKILQQDLIDRWAVLFGA